MRNEDEFMPSDEEERISLEAAEWLVKQDRGLTPEEQDQFFDWLRRDERHRLWFADHDELWDHCETLSDWKPKHSAKPNPDLLALPKKRAVGRLIWIGGGIGIAAVLALAVILFAPDSNQEGYEDRLLAEGSEALEYQRHFLSDGSLVELNKGAQVAVRYTPERREVLLLSGEAFFSVAKDRERPFAVKASGAVVEAVGTAFSVSLKGDAVEVLVTEGRVRMDVDSEMHSEIADDLGEPFDLRFPKRELIAGELSSLSLASGAAEASVERVEPEAIDERLAWKIEVFDFDATPLREVVRRFNERNAVQMKVSDATIADLPVTATFKSNNPAGFARLMEITGKLTTQRDDRGNIILEGPY